MMMHNPPPHQTRLRFFNLDLHVSVIEDVKTIWKHLFPDHVEIVDWSISGHAHLFPHAMAFDNPVIHRRNWRNFNSQMIRDFHREFDTFLQQFDGFIVTHTPIFAMLFEKYGKPIIIVNSCRYHQPICWSQDWNLLESFHTTLANLHSKNLLTIVHNNIADAHFFMKSVRPLDLSEYYVPSLCQYTNATYNPVLSTILVDDPQHLLKDISGKHPTLLHKKSSPYEWRDLYEHRAVIVIPRETSYMTFFEYLTATLPILIPSKTFLLELIAKHDLKLGTLRAYNMKGELKEWIDRADYYNPGVLECLVPFDSFQHLEELLQQPNLDEHVLLPSHRRLVQRKERVVEPKVYETWNDIFHIDYFQFISYNFWPCLAKYHLDVDYSNVPVCRPFYKPNAIHPSTMTNNDLIFVKTDLLDVFVQYYLPMITTRFRIVMGVSDLSPDPSLLHRLVQHELCTKVYSTNILQQHAKIVPIPIGFSEPMRTNGNPTLLRKWYHKSLSCKKDIDLFVRHFSTTCTSRSHYEEQVKKMLCGDRRFLDTVHLKSPTKDSDELHGYLHRSKFALCLRGNGVDTHYFYECILNECVPIFLNDQPFPLYDSFACLQIRTASELETRYSKLEMDEFYKNIDWQDQKSRLFRLSYTYLRSC